MLSDAKPVIFFVVGRSGAGKRTMCTRLTKDFPQFHHLNVGECLRACSASGSAHSDEIKKCMDEGELVPDELTIPILKNLMVRAGWGKKKYLISGFPRNQSNLEGW